MRIIEEILGFGFAAVVGVVILGVFAWGVVFTVAMAWECLFGQWWREHKAGLPHTPLNRTYWRMRRSVPPHVEHSRSDLLDLRARERGQRANGRQPEWTSTNYVGPTMKEPRVPTLPDLRSGATGRPPYKPWYQRRHFGL